MLNDYMNQGQVMKTADRKLLHYIASAAYHLRQAEEYLDDYKELENVSYYKGLREEWPNMATLYKQLAHADIAAAKHLVHDLEDAGLLNLWDWMKIYHTLTLFDVPAEDRYD